MKKIDCLIILLFIFVFSIIYIFIYKPYINNLNNNQIQILVNNQLIKEIDLSINNIYIIKSNNQLIEIYENDKLIKTIPSNNKQIYNKIIISNNKVLMKESNCKGKDCMYMEINKQSKFPIICTNGIVIKYSNKNKNYSSDIII